MKVYSEEEKTAIILMEFVGTLAVKPTAQREDCKIEIIIIIHYIYASSV